jgi:hypothetical protein
MCKKKRGESPVVSNRIDLPGGWLIRSSARPRQTDHMLSLSISCGLQTEWPYVSDFSDDVQSPDRLADVRGSKVQSDSTGAIAFRHPITTWQRRITVADVISDTNTSMSRHLIPP